MFSVRMLGFLGSQIRGYCVILQLHCHFAVFIFAIMAEIVSDTSECYPSAYQTVHGLPIGPPTRV